MSDPKEQVDAIGTKKQAEDAALNSVLESHTKLHNLTHQVTKQPDVPELKPAAASLVNMIRFTKTLTPKSEPKPSENSEPAASKSMPDCHCVCHPDTRPKSAEIGEFKATVNLLAEDDVRQALAPQIIIQPEQDQHISTGIESFVTSSTLTKEEPQKRVCQCFVRRMRLKSLPKTSLDPIQEEDTEDASTKVSEFTRTCSDLCLCSCHPGSTGKVEDKNLNMLNVEEELAPLTDVVLRNLFEAMRQEIKIEDPRLNDEISGVGIGTIRESKEDNETHQLVENEQCSSTLIEAVPQESKTDSQVIAQFNNIVLGFVPEADTSETNDHQVEESLTHGQSEERPSLIQKKRFSREYEERAPAIINDTEISNLVSVDNETVLFDDDLQTIGVYGAAKENVQHSNFVEELTGETMEETFEKDTDLMGEVVQTENSQTLKLEPELEENSTVKEMEKQGAAYFEFYNRSTDQQKPLIEEVSEDPESNAEFIEKYSTNESTNSAMDSAKPEETGAIEVPELKIESHQMQNVSRSQGRTDRESSTVIEQVPHETQNEMDMPIIAKFKDIIFGFPPKADLVDLEEQKTSVKESHIQENAQSDVRSSFTQKKRFSREYEQRTSAIINDVKERNLTSVDNETVFFDSNLEPLDFDQTQSFSTQSATQAEDQFVQENKEQDDEQSTEENFNQSSTNKESPQASKPPGLDKDELQILSEALEPEIIQIIEEAEQETEPRHEQDRRSSTLGEVYNKIFDAPQENLDGVSLAVPTKSKAIPFGFTTEDSKVEEQQVDKKIGEIQSDVQTYVDSNAQIDESLTILDDTIKHATEASKYFDARGHPMNDTTLTSGDTLNDDPSSNFQPANLRRFDATDDLSRLGNESPKLSSSSLVRSRTIYMKASKLSIDHMKLSSASVNADGETKRPHITVKSSSDGVLKDQEKQEPAYQAYTGDIEDFHYCPSNQLPRSESITTVASALLVSKTKTSETKILGAKSEKHLNKKSRNNDDDDGFTNLKVPSHSLSHVESSAWINENASFVVTETPSVHARSSLGQDKTQLMNEAAATSSRLDEPQPEKKRSTLKKCKCMLQRLSKVFRKSKDDKDDIK